MSQFNHKYKQLCDALGLESSRSDYLKELCRKSMKDTDCMSEAIEKVLEEGLSVIETMFCGHLLGYNDALNSNRTNDQIMGGAIITPGGKPIDLSGEQARHLKDLLDKLKGRLESDDETPGKG